MIIKKRVVVPRLFLKPGEIKRDPRLQGRVSFSFLCNLSDILSLALDFFFLQKVPPPPPTPPRRLSVSFSAARSRL